LAVHVTYESSQVAVQVKNWTEVGTGEAVAMVRETVLIGVEDRGAATPNPMKARSPRILGGCIVSEM